MCLLGTKMVAYPMIMGEASFTNVATFIMKLWKMLEDISSSQIMSWAESGKSFVIHQPIDFTVKLLPKYFRHKNLGSFVRQLNLYDFHKISRENSLEQHYQCKYFRRNRPELLKYIKRKQAQFKRDTTKSNECDLQNVSKEMENVKKHQDKMSKQLVELQQDNLSMLRDIKCLHAKTHTQTQVVSKIIELLIPYMEKSPTNASKKKNSLEMSVYTNNPVQENGNNVVNSTNVDAELLNSVNSFSGLRDIMTFFNTPSSTFDDSVKMLKNENQSCVEDMTKDDLNFLLNTADTSVDMADIFPGELME